jgi:hypothetical protein
MCQVKSVSYSLTLLLALSPLIFLIGCASSSKRKVVFDVITDDQGAVYFKRNRRDLHDNYRGEVTVTDYDFAGVR